MLYLKQKNSENETKAVSGSIVDQMQDLFLELFA